MTPARKTTIGETEIKQYYWAGEWPVYVNSQLSDLTYEEAIEAAERERVQAELDDAADAEAYLRERQAEDDAAAAIAEEDAEREHQDHGQFGVGA